MAKKNNTGNKKVVVTTKKDTTNSKLNPTVSKVSATTSKVATKESRPEREMLFTKENFIWMGAGAALLFIGLLLMTGGHQAPNEWNADEVYSFRRVTLAPLVMLAGLIVTLISIFKGSKKEASEVA